MTIPHLPGFGPLSVHEHFSDWFCTEELDSALLGRCRFTVTDLEHDEADPQAAAAALRNFLALDAEAAQAKATPHLYAYYRVCLENATEVPEITGPADVWQLVGFTRSPVLELDWSSGDWFVCLSNHCDWEPEHGLYMTYRHGNRLTRVGPYGDRTNRQEWGDPTIPEDTIFYWPS